MKSLNKDLLNGVQRQIVLELESSLAYLSLASWASLKGYLGSAEFFQKQSGEEQDHMKKIMNYLIDLGEMPLFSSPSLKLPKFSTLKDLFDYSIKQERLVSASIHSLVEEALEDKDFRTFNFFQWFVEEQREEERSIQKILDWFSLIDLHAPSDIFAIDERIGRLSSAS